MWGCFVLVYICSVVSPGGRWEREVEYRYIADHDIESGCTYIVVLEISG